jgi:uncharacterized protein YkwD
MTLTKATPKRPRPADRKRSGQHHRHSRHYVKTYWPYLPVLAIMLCGLVLNNWLGKVNHSVLGYATDVSGAALLADTNTQRAAQGEKPLSMNGQLTTAAQAKANDMAARDYWSHVTPDGQQPWVFIDNAGYSYQAAGENLAYGFGTSDQIIDAWMNSPEHRANILNASYQDVGFGIINIANYQGEGPQTLVVAMYAQPLVAPAAAAAPTPAKPTPATAPTQTTQTAPVPTTPITTATPESQQNATTKAADNSAAAGQPVRTVSEERVARIQLMTGAAWTQLALAALAGGIIVLFLLRHTFAWHKALIKGERFVLHHPAIDAAGATVIVVSLLLIQTTGLIR